MITTVSKTNLSIAPLENHFIGFKKTSAGSFIPMIFLEDPSEVQLAELTLSDTQSLIFERLLETLSRIPEGNTDIDFTGKVDLDDGSKLGARLTDATSSIPQVFLENSGGTEIASVSFTENELRQFKYILSQINRAPQD